MANFQLWQPASRLGRSIVTQVATAQTNATQSTTGFSLQTYQVRVYHTLNGTAGIWATIGSTTTDVTANSSAVLLPAGWPEYFAVTSGQHFNFISTSTSTGYVVVTELV
jgi:hypothetical protein